MAKPEYFDSQIGKWVFLGAELSTLPVDSRLDWTNGYHKGYRWGHFTVPENQEGMFHLSQLSYVQNEENSDYTSTRLLTFNENSNDSFAFYKPILMNADLDMQGNQITNFSIDVGSGGVTGELLIAHLEGYPNSSSVFLRGDGTWAATPGIRSLTVSGSSGLNVSGSPVTGSTGTINLTLGTELQSLSELNTTGFLIRTGAASYETGAILGTEGQIEVANGSGIEGDPVISLAATGVSAGAYRLPTLTIDSLGRVLTATEEAVPINRLENYPANPEAVLKGDGTWGTVSVAGVVPPGTVLLWAGSALPSGFLWCDGAVYISGAYPDLFAAIDKAWGYSDLTTYTSPYVKRITDMVLVSGTTTCTTEKPHYLIEGDIISIYRTNGSSIQSGATITGVPANNKFTYTGGLIGETVGFYKYHTIIGPGRGAFNVPDTRGLFPRGVNTVNGLMRIDTAYRDPDAASRVALYGGNTGDKVGTYQLHDFKGHSHTMNHGHTTGTTVSPSLQVGSSYSDTVTDKICSGVNGGNRLSVSLQVFDYNGYTGVTPAIGTGGNETRPGNFSINYIIKT